MSEPMRFSLKHHGQLSCVEHCPEGEYVLHSDYARLKAEVERLNLDAYKKLSMRIEIDKLKARIEYLTNAGDAMADAINGDYNHSLPCIEAWNAAKEGKPSV